MAEELWERDPDEQRAEELYAELDRLEQSGAAYQAAGQERALAIVDEIRSLRGSSMEEQLAAELAAPAPRRRRGRKPRRTPHGR